MRACAALHIYSDNQAEIAAVAVDETFSNLGIGPKMIEFLIKRAKSRNVKSIFILTTRTSDWFEKIGFCPDKTDSMSEERKALWSPERNSKLFRLNICP
nr:GNAT family N-acetyltransferase [Treponema sp.]